MTNNIQKQHFLPTGKERGEHDAACLQSYFTLGIPERLERVRQYDLTQSDDYEAHSKLLDLLGIPEPDFTNTTEHIQPLEFTIPQGAFFVRQITVGIDDSVVSTTYRAWYQQ